MFIFSLFLNVFLKISMKSQQIIEIKFTIFILKLYK